MEPITLDEKPASPIDGRFHLQEEAGRGGMGVVWRAWDQTGQTWVAVKVLHVMRATVAARFDREIRLLDRVGHPFIVRYLDQGQLPDGRRYLVMEWVEGETLAQRLHRGSLSLEDAVELGRKLASALGAAHRQQVIHRDFKPSNVLLLGGDLRHPRLLDFGIARDVDSQTHLTASEAILGTPGYVAPEQARSSRLADPRADIYALGVTLYECMTGCLPFGGATPIERLMAPLQSPPTPLRNLRPDASPYLEQIFDRMLARDPNQRPQDGDTAERWLAAASSSLHGTTPLETMASLPPLTPASGTQGATPALGPSLAPPAGSEPASHTAMDMVDSLDIVPTRRNPPKHQGRPWPWIALAATMLVVGLGGGYWLSRDTRRTAEPAADDDDARTREDEDAPPTEPRKTVAPAPRKKKRRGPKVPHQSLPEKVVCPGEHCKLIPAKHWDGIELAQAFRLVERRRRKLYPKAKFTSLSAPSVRDGRLYPRTMAASTLFVTYADAGKQIIAHFMMARVSFKRGSSGVTTPPAIITTPDLSRCTFAQAYRQVHGRLDATWKEGATVAMSWMTRRASPPWTTVWVLDDTMIDTDTCRPLVLP